MKIHNELRWSERTFIKIVDQIKNHVGYQQFYLKFNYETEIYGLEANETLEIRRKHMLRWKSD